MSAPAAEEHPRPLLRRAWTSLDDEWDVALDPDGQVEHPRRVSWSRTIRVPFAPETPASGIGWQGPLRRVWYSRDLPARQADRRTVVHLGTVDRTARVDVDVTDALPDTGSARLVVRTDDDPRDMAAPRGKQDWRDEPHSSGIPVRPASGAPPGPRTSPPCASLTCTGPASRWR